MITFNTVIPYLPAGSFEFVGNNQVKLNFNTLTGQELTLDSSSLMGIVKLLTALAQATTAINQQRAAQSPPLATIKFVEQVLAGTPQQPEYHFTVELAVDSGTFINNLIDPTAS